MANTLQATSVPLASEPAAQRSPLSSARTHAYLARLASLHDEAGETAHLANLLGRTPWAAGVMGAAGLATAFLSFGSAASASLAVWLALMALAMAVTAWSYQLAIAAPFDLKSLQEFARKLSAILLFAGAVWGAGLSLALGPGVGFAGSLAYVGGTSAVLAAILRTRDVSFCFLVPATAMGAFCALMQGFNTTAMAGVLLAGLAVAGAALLLERVAELASGTA